MSTLLAHDSHAHAPDPHPGQTLFDKVGLGVSLTCAVHCVITSLITLLPTMGISALGPTMEWLELPMLVGALLVGLFALMPPYLKEHKKPLPIFLFGMGIFFVGGGRFVSGWTETALTVVGISFVATAHVVNLRLHTAHHAHG